MGLVLSGLTGDDVLSGWKGSEDNAVIRDIDGPAVEGASKERLGGRKLSSWPFSLVLGSGAVSRSVWCP